MKRYSEYKDSGVKWIGEIPGHWKSIKLHHLISKIESGTSVNGSTSQYAKSNEYGVLKTGSVSFRIFDDKQNKLVEGQEIKRLTCPVVKNTIIVSRMNTPELVGSCAIVEKDYPNLYLPDRLWQVYFTKASNLKFLHWVLNGMYVRTYYASICVGSSSTMQNISQSQFSDTKIAFPPLPEQETIVTYLDSKVAKIDEYISIAEKKIAALEELKQTIIAEAVTRGIHKDVPMKDSGVKWIGMIPEHWDLSRAKNIFERKFRPVRDCDEVVTCFRDGQVTLRKNRRVEGFTESLKEIGYQGIRKGDLVIHQMDAFAGSIGVSDSDGKGTPVYICCLPKDEKNVNVYFYAYLLREMARSGFIKSLYRGIRERSSDFRFDTFAVQWLPLVPIEEQQEIVNYIEAKVANINQLCQAERSQIEKLKEYKQRLISDVVTGKVKVTND